MDFSHSLPCLLALRCKSAWFNFLDYAKTVISFYSNPAYRRADLALLSSYLFINPYKLSRRFLEKRGSLSIYAYGETPIATLDRLAERAHIGPKDLVYELGCGRGRACFWLALIKQARVIGIDFIPEFIEKAEEVRKQESIGNLEFRCEDFLNSDLKEATFIYLHGSCMEDGDILKLNQRLIGLKKEIRVLTVSFSMKEYDEAHWIVTDVFVERMSWGLAEVFLQTLII